ncbi:alkaline phosphatase [Novosphingobium album (ex Liu et al. 2023)]|uniref:Alkaline phosphatase n=1 Tax=Novosphingobium album (ex Liu et al. 2023) TaxID=3031130 RepID=A0ABT5WVW4_9SPHN|nr:alkaline phosphatase [Novosphingobium album (ex Liu et al. 2023)]MDE8654048.1 alkaline phosphatase [Novosphingobium album (ex Liu et al. 2023)]
MSMFRRNPPFPAASRRHQRPRKGLALAGIVAGILLAAGGAGAKEPQARNVILFLGDAGGLPTISAAGILANDRPQSLYIQSLPDVGLSDTSALNRWVTDSAAGMTAIMTGHKTNNAMVSVVPSGDGGATAPVKTLLEYAEQRGLSTGVITNMKIWDATPAACYAHVASRKETDEIFRQMLAPRFGDGVDILIGKGRADAAASFAKLQTTAEQAFTRAGYRFGDDPALVREAGRAAVLRDEDFAPMPAVEAAIGQLARNPKGYFLMVEWDMHTPDPRKGLRHVVEMDDMIRRVSAIAGKDTLILFTADHSFALRMGGGTRGTPLADQFAAETAKPGVTTASNAVISVEDNHTGEEVIAAASGPGAGQVRGFFANTHLFDIMMAALGWQRDN